MTAPPLSVEVLEPVPYAKHQAPPIRSERWWLHILLFALTLATTTWVGASFAVNFRPSLAPSGSWSNADLARLATGALTFSLPLLTILLAHEMGHYLMCRKYRIDASLPFFIPFPSLVGTMGAFIRIREPFRTKTALFDVGVAGPIAGFVVSLPILVYGITHTRINTLPVEEGTLIFHYPLLVLLIQKLFLGVTFSSIWVIEHPAFLAGWFGLFVTALNLIPIGQLDGGHALYAVLGRRTKWVVFPLFAAILVLGLKFHGWFVWAILLVVMGLRHPRLVDEDEPLDPRRKKIALLILAIFVLCFVPVPLEEMSELPARRSPQERGGTFVHQLHVHRGAESPG